jgi:hypothetical protein
MTQKTKDGATRTPIKVYRVAQYLVFCVMFGGLLVGFLWPNLLFSVSWLVEFWWVRVAQTLVFCVMAGTKD